MWYNSNYLKMLLLAAYPGHIRVDFGRSVTPNVNHETQAIDDIIATGNTPYATGGALQGSYQYNDNSSGTFAFTVPAMRTTTISPGDIVAKEMAVFYHGYVQTGDDSMGEQSILLYYEAFEEGVPAPTLKDFATSVTYAINNFVRFQSPEEHERIVRLGISSTTGMGTTNYVDAKVCVHAVNATVANTAASFPKYLGDKSYALSIVYWHQGTATQLNGFGSADYWASNQDVGQYRMNSNGTVTFTVKMPLDVNSATANAGVGRFYITVGSLRIDVMLPATYWTTTAGDYPDQAGFAERWQLETKSRENLEFVFTLGNPDEDFVYLPNPLRSGRAAKYITMFRKPSLLTFVRNAADNAFQGYPGTGYEYNLKWDISKTLISPEITWYGGENNLTWRQRIKHTETGVYVHDTDYPSYASQGKMANIVGGKYEMALKKQYYENGQAGLSGISPTLLERDAITPNEPTLLNADLSGLNLDTLRINKNGVYVPFDKNTKFTTLFGSQVELTDSGIMYHPDLSTGAYSGKTDSIYVANGNEVSKIEIPLEAIKPTIVEEEFVYHANVSTAYYTTTSARYLRPDRTDQKEGTWSFTVPANFVHDFRVKNMLAYACRVELYDTANDELVDSVILGASVLPTSTHTFEELQPKKYTVVYTSIGMELETDKRPYIYATNIQRQYNLLSITGDISKPVFTIFKDDENQQDWDVYHRNYNALLAFSWTAGRIWNLRGGRLVLSKAGLVTFTPTIGNRITGVEDFSFSMVIVSKDGRQQRHRNYRILIHPDIDIPDAASILVIDEMKRTSLGGNKYRITPKYTIYPTSRTYTDHNLDVVIGKKQSEVVSLPNDDGSSSLVVDVTDPLTHTAVMVSYTDVANGYKRGGAKQVNFSDVWRNLTTNDIEIVNEKVTQGETETLQYRALTFDKSELPEDPVWSVVGNPNGVTIRNKNQLIVTADVKTPFKIRLYMRGLWVEKWFTTFPKTTAVAIVIPPGDPFYPEEPINLSYTLTPPESLDNGTPTWDIYSGGGATFNGNTLTFAPTTVNRQVRIRMLYKGLWSPLVYVNCIPKPVEPDPEPVEP